VEGLCGSARHRLQKCQRVFKVTRLGLTTMGLALGPLKWQQYLSAAHNFKCMNGKELFRRYICVLVSVLVNPGEIISYSQLRKNIPRRKGRTEVLVSRDTIDDITN
jgi:hypothetical protein